MQHIQYWLKGVRLYIAVGALLGTGITVWWAQVAYSGGPLVAIRSEEVFAWAATGLLVIALSIGPVYKLFPRLAGRKLWFEARRLNGVSAAWFASWHASIAYTAQFKWANPFSLPSNYQLAFGLGAGALLVLLAMAITSFDKALAGMGVWWFRLHRLVYVAVALVLLHLFMIGVHAGVLGVLWSLTAAAVLVLGLHVAILIKLRHASVWQALAVSLMAVILGFCIGYGFHERRVNLQHHTTALSSRELAG